MDDVELRKQENRGQKAKALLENPLLTEAFDKVDSLLVEIWRDAKDPNIREDAHRAVSLLPKIKAAIETHVHAGDLAKKKLEQLVRPKRGPF